MRGGSFSHDKVIHLLNSYFVPVYISHTAHEEGDAPAEEKKEWQRIYHEANSKLKRSGTVHVYILAPGDAAVIESIDIGTATVPEKLLSRLEPVVRRLKTTEGKVLVKPEPQSHPPKSDADSLVLHMVARAYKGTWTEFPSENWTVLSRAEVIKLLGDGNGTVGKSWDLDEAITAKFLARFLPNGFGYAPHHKISILEQSLKAKVATVQNGVVHAQLEGRLKLKHKNLDFQKQSPVEIEEFAEMPLAGYLDFDSAKKEVRAFRLLADPATARGGYVQYAVGLRSMPSAARDSNSDEIPRRFDRNGEQRLLTTRVPKPAPKEVLLFDFEDPADVKVWANLELPESKYKEPPAKIELWSAHATSGTNSLKITFAGGRWPTITTTNVLGDWMPYQTFSADVTVDRPCLVGFCVLQEKSRRFGDWDGAVSRWCKTQLLQPGKNSVSGPIHDSNNYSINTKLGNVVRFEIFMYAPHDGESIFVDNIRLSTVKETPLVVKPSFTVLGTDLIVPGVQELGKKLEEQWTKPTDRTVGEVVSAFKAKFEELKKTHPNAILAILRDGEKNYDPADPDKVYSGWKDAYWSSHGPDGMTLERADNQGKRPVQEVFMRHRSPLMRVDLSSIPPGSKVLSAQLVIVRARPHFPKDHNPYEKPTMWVAEACNRPWVETEVNAYEYAKDKFWKAIGGMYYGDDPDFLPIYLAHGQGLGKVNAWDFTEAVRFWTDGKHANHGFMLHGDGHDYISAFTREAEQIHNRPAVLVVYEDPPGAEERSGGRQNQQDDARDQHRWAALQPLPRPLR